MGFVSGGQLVARALKHEGVRCVFTLCGGHVQMIYDGCLDHGIRVVDTRHEQSAGHAADGWARITGSPGVAIVTAGPGVTDVVTAVASAQRAQVPMLVLGGQGARMLSQFGGQDRGALQEMNHVELMRPICKWAVSVPETKRLSEYVQSAFRVATSGTPGPVFLEMPLDTLVMGVDESEVVAYEGYRTGAKAAPDPAYLARAAEVLLKAERPMLIVGSQWRWSTDREALRAFAERHRVPIFLNGMARGALGKRHPQAFRHCRKQALGGADVVIIFGTPLDFRLGYGEAIPKDATLVQVDLDGAELGRNRRVDIGIVGDSGLTLRALELALGQKVAGSTAWLDSLRAHEAKRQATIDESLGDRSTPINPLALCHELEKHIDDNTIVIGDGGDFVATAAYVVRPSGVGSWMDPGPLGTLGVGPGYAMAAKLARPDARVLLLSGDGTFGLNGFELEAMVRQGIKITCVIGNDGAWSQIRRGQIEMYGEERAVATSLAYTRYDLVAEALGAHAEYVEAPEALPGALERAFAADRAAVVNVRMRTGQFRQGALAV